MHNAGCVFKPHLLPESVQTAISAEIGNLFNDLQFYDHVVAPYIPSIVSDGCKSEISVKSTRNLTERYFNIDSFRGTPAGKIVLSQIHIIVRCVYVLILEHHPSSQLIIWHDIDQFLRKYSEFKGQSTSEQKLLLRFRNMMALAKCIIPAKLNKKMLIDICGRLEGSGNLYITGSGQKPSTARRVLIYEQEGNVSVEKRLERKRKPKRYGEPNKTLTTSISKIRRISADQLDNEQFWNYSIIQKLSSTVSKRSSDPRADSNSVAQGSKEYDSTLMPPPGTIDGKLSHENLNSARRSLSLLSSIKYASNFTQDSLPFSCIQDEETKTEIDENETTACTSAHLEWEIIDSFQKQLEILFKESKENEELNTDEYVHPTQFMRQISLNFFTDQFFEDLNHVVEPVNNEVLRTYSTIIQL